MDLSGILNLLAAVFAGFLVPIQTALNTQLTRALLHPVMATSVVFIVAGVSATAAVLALRLPMPSRAEFMAAPALSWVGGGLVAVIYVALLSKVAPRIGALTAVAAVMLGQILCSAIIDQFGLFGFAQQAISLPRLAGIALLVAGVTLIKIY